MDRFARFGLTSGMAGGLLLAVGAALSSVGSSGPPSHQVTTAVFVNATVMRLLGGIGLLLGVTGITAHCGRRGGGLLYTGYLVAVGGLVLNLGWIWADLFVIDTIAKLDPAFLDTSADLGTRLDVGFMTAWLGNLGLAVLAVAVARTRTVPRWSWIALFVSGAITLVPLPFDGEIFEVFIGLPFAAGMAGALMSRHTAHPVAEAALETAA